MSTLLVLQLSAILFTSDGIGSATGFVVSPEKHPYNHRELRRRSSSALPVLPPDASDLLLQGLSTSQVIAGASSIAAATTTTTAILDIIRADSDPNRYLFMLPTAALVSTSCQLAGIGGAALFSPIFLLLFPLLGPDYPLSSAAAAVASALLTECFGFASGLIGYASRGLVDWGVAGRFLVVSVPAAIGGATIASSVADHPVLLQSVYAALMIGLALYLTLNPAPDALETLASEECAIRDIDDEAIRFKTARDGTEFTYLAPSNGSVKGVGATAAGGSLTGLLGVGIGEVVLPQLVRGCCMPLPVAAGTSVAVVVVTALTAAVVQFTALASGIGGTVEGGGSGVAETSSVVDGLIRVVPWNLVKFTIPGVLVGGQIAPFLASRGQFSDDQIEQFAATLFGLVGIAFAVKAIVG